MDPEEIEKLEDQHGLEGEQHLRDGRFADALTAFQAAHKLANERNDKAAAGIWLANCGSTHLAAGENAQAQMCLEEALKTAIELGWTKNEMQIRRSLAIACFEQLNAEMALENVNSALRIAREIGDQKMEVELIGYLGIASTIKGEYEAAAEYYEQAMEIAREKDYKSEIGVLTGNLGINFLRLEEYEQAIENLEKALDIARHVGDQINEEKWKAGLEVAREHLQRELNPETKAKYDYHVALKSHSLIEPEKAVELWLRAARSCRVARDYLHCGDSLANAGLILNNLERFQEADRRYHEAMDAFRAAGDDKRRSGLVLVNWAVSLRDRDELERAINMLTEAIDLLRAAHAAEELAHALTTLADMQLGRQEEEKSTTLLKEAAQIYRDLGLKGELAKVLIRLGSVVGDPKDSELLLRESIEVASAARDFETQALAIMSLASHLAEQGNIDQAVSELMDMKARVLQESSSEISRRYLLLLGNLLDDSKRRAEAFGIGHELLEVADREGDLQCAAHAFGIICPAYAFELRVIRNRMNERLGRSVSEIEAHERSLVPDMVPLTVETEDDAIQLARSLMEARNQAATGGNWASGRAREIEQALGNDTSRSPMDWMGQIISARATEFNKVFFASLVFNVEHAISHGDSDRARALVELARFIASVQSHSLRVDSTLLTQLVEEDQTEIIHLEPGATFSPVPGNEIVNRRVAEETYREATRHMAAQRFGQAFQLYGSALKLLQHIGKDTGECLGNLAYCASVIGRFDAAIQYAGQAAREFLEKGDRGSEAKALLIVGGVHQKLGDFDQAIQAYEEALAAARASEMHDVEASAISNIGSAWYQRGEIRRALELQEEALDIKRKYSDDSSLVSTLCNLASLKRRVGDLNGSSELLTEAQSIIEATGNKEQMAVFLNNAASVAISEGSPAEGESLLQRAREIAEEIDSSPLRAQVLENLVIVFRKQGKWNALDEALAAVEELHRESGNDAGLAKHLMLRLDAALIRGDYEGAIMANMQLADRFSEFLSPAQGISLLVTLRDCFAATGRREEGAELTAEMLRIVDENTKAGAGTTPEIFLLSCRVYARLASEGEADEEEAHRLLLECIEICEREGDERTALELHEARASIFRRQGRLRESIESHKRALGSLEKFTDEFERATIMSNLATTLRQAGQLQDSYLMFQEAMAIARQIDAHALRAQILQKASAVAHDLGRLGDVEELAWEAVKISRLSGDRATEARALLILAGRLMEMGDAMGAEGEFRTILADDKRLPQDVRAEARAGCALALRAQQRYDEAIDLIYDAIALGRASAIDQATNHFYAGLIFSEYGQLNEASKNLDVAIQLIGQDAISPLGINIRQVRGDIHRKQGDLLASEREYRLAIGDLRLLRRRVFHKRDLLHRLAEFAVIPQKLTDVLLSQQRFTEAFAALEEAKSRSFVDRLGLGDLPIPEAVPHDLCEREHQIIEEILQLEWSFLHARSVEQRRRLDADYSRAVNEHDKLLEEIAGYEPDYVRWRRGAAITFEDVVEILRR